MKGQKVLACAIAITMLVSGLAFVNVVTGSSEPEPTPRAGSSPKTMLVETFTADWCIFCPPQAHSIERLVEEYGYDKLVFIEHHSDSGDPLYLAESGSRASYYGVTGVPTVIFDGGGPYTDTRLWESGGDTKYGVYPGDKADIYSETGQGAPCTMSVDGQITGTGGYAHITMDYTNVPSETNLQLQVMILENTLYHDVGVEESYGHHRVYNHVCRDILPVTTLPAGLAAGSHLEYNMSFTLNSGWYPSMDIRRIGIAAFIQTTNTYGADNHPVLQAAYHKFIEEPILLVNADGSDLIDNGMDHLDEELTKINAPHHVWDTNETTDSATLNARTMPTYAQMAPYPLVIWYTGLDTTTLTATDRTNIGQYLDGGGCVYMEGAYIAEDANANGWTSWLQTYLHSNYVSGNTGGTAITGNTADPIGDGLAGVAIHTTSPDGLSPVGGTAAVSFQYQTVGGNAMIRATHTSGSRSILTGCNYFLVTSTTDASTTDETILRRIINWTDGALPPKVTVTAPNGGQWFNGTDFYQIKWEANDVAMPTLPISLYYCTDYPVATWTLIASGETNDGIYNWTVPWANSSACRIRIVAIDSQGQNGEDISDTDFIIGNPNDPPYVDLTGPDGGEIWRGNTVNRIWWNMSDDKDAVSQLLVNLSYSSTGIGGPWTQFLSTAGFTANPCYYDWTAPSINSTQMRIQISVLDTWDDTTWDNSTNDFEIDSTWAAPATNFRAELTGTNDVTLYWTASPDSDVVYYHIYALLNTWDPTGDSYTTLVANTTGTSYLHVGQGNNSGNQYCYQLRTYDKVGHETRTIGQAGKFTKLVSYPLGTSWYSAGTGGGYVLLGSSLEQSSYAFSHKLQGVGLGFLGWYNWTAIRTYNPWDTADPWKINVRNATASHNEITTINNTQGFYINLHAGIRYASAGKISNLTIPLKAGWNLVPYPLITTQTTSALRDHLVTNCPGFSGSYTHMNIFRTYSSAGSGRLINPTGTESLNRQEAFWVWVSSETVWTVNYY